MSKKSAILREAVRLFAVKGFEATSTAEIARAAGVAEGTIFHHFKSKDGVLLHVFHEMMEIYLKGLTTEAQEGSTGLDAVRRALGFHFRFIQEHSREALLMFRTLPFRFQKPDFPFRDYFIERAAAIVDLFRGMIERGQEDGSVREVSPEKAAYILKGVLGGVTRQSLVGVPKAPDLSEEAIDFCCEGLAGRRQRAAACNGVYQEHEL